MKTLCVLLVGVAIGWAASGVDWNRDAVAEVGRASDEPFEERPVGTERVRAADLTWIRERVERDSNGRKIVRQFGSERIRDVGQSGRFHVSAYGSTNGNGCYIVDTATGQTWLTRNGQPPEVVSKGLLDKSPDSSPLPPGYSIDPTLTPRVEANGERPTDTFVLPSGENE